MWLVPRWPIPPCRCAPLPGDRPTLGSHAKHPRPGPPPLPAQLPHHRPRARHQPRLVRVAGAVLPHRVPHSPRKPQARETRRAAPPPGRAVGAAFRGPRAACPLPAANAVCALGARPRRAPGLLSAAPHARPASANCAPAVRSSIAHRRNVHTARPRRAARTGRPTKAPRSNPNPPRRHHTEEAVAREFPGFTGTSDFADLLARSPGSLMYSWASPELVELMSRPAAAAAGLPAGGSGLSVRQVGVWGGDGGARGRDRQNGGVRPGVRSAGQERTVTRQQGNAPGHQTRTKHALQTGGRLNQQTSEPEPFGINNPTGAGDLKPGAGQRGDLPDRVEAGRGPHDRVPVSPVLGGGAALGVATPTEADRTVAEDGRKRKRKLACVRRSRFSGIRARRRTRPAA